MAFNSAESTRCFETRRRSLSASASICEVETFRVLPIVESRTLMQTVFLARSTPGSAIGTENGALLPLTAGYLLSVWLDFGKAGCR
jgi:hypothetical protein